MLDACGLLLACAALVFLFGTSLAVVECRRVPALAATSAATLCGPLLAGRIATPIGSMLVLACLLATLALALRALRNRPDPRLRLAAWMLAIAAAGALLSITAAIVSVEYDVMAGPEAASLF